MKTETLLLLIGGGAALLWFMDKQDTTAVVAPSGTPPVGSPSGIGPGQLIFPPASGGVPPSPPHHTCPPTQQLAADGQTCVDLQPSTPVFHPLPLRTRYVDPLLTPPVADPSQRETRTGTPGALAGLSVYGGWGR